MSESEEPTQVEESIDSKPELTPLPFELRQRPNATADAASSTPKKSPSELKEAKVDLKSLDVQTILAKVESALEKSPVDIKLFALAWFPLLFSGIGAIVGFILSGSGHPLILSLVAAGVTYKLFPNAQAYNEQGNVEKGLLAFTFLPLLMIDGTEWFLPVFLMVAVAGAPFVLASLPKAPTLSEKASILSLTVASVVIFGVASGGSGLFNALILGGLFTAASYIVPHVPLDKVKDISPLKEYVFANPGLATVLVNHLIAKVLLYLVYGLILPASFFEKQNNTFSDVVYTAIGFAVLLGGFFLRQSKQPQQYKDLYILAVLGSSLFGLLIPTTQQMVR